MKFKEGLVNFWDAFVLKKHATGHSNLAGKIAWHNLRYSRFLVVFSFAAVILILVLLEMNGGGIKRIETLQMSWSLFFITVFLGLFFHSLHVLSVVFRINYERLVDETKKTGKDSGVERSSNLHSIFLLLRYMYISLVIQTMLFFGSTLLLIYFFIFNF